MSVTQRFQVAIQAFWQVREAQRRKQEASGRSDAGSRGAVTGGRQMAALERLVSELLLEVGLAEHEIHTQRALELPGYYRPEKQWDLVVISRGQLVAALEFKSQVGPSFGNNFNNRTEEAIGNAEDLWTAFREGRFGTSSRPFLGYFFLLEDCPEVHQPVSVKEPSFSVDPAFIGASYSQRYELFCRRLVLERLYDAACLTLATNAPETAISFPEDDLSFQRFIGQLQGHVFGFLRGHQT